MRPGGGGGTDSEGEDLDLVPIEGVEAGEVVGVSLRTFGGLPRLRFGGWAGTSESTSILMSSDESLLSMVSFLLLPPLAATPSKSSPTSDVFSSPFAFCLAPPLHPPLHPPLFPRFLRLGREMNS